MNDIIVEFQIQSKRTAPFNAKPFNEDQLNTFLTNYSMGLVGEYLELCQTLDEVEFIDYLEEEKFTKLWDSYIKELGDVWHYLINLFTVLEENFDINKCMDPEKRCIYVIGDFVELVKKKVYHGHLIEKEILIEKLYQIAKEIIDYSDYELANVLDTNIEKLKKRYPNEFNVRDSIKRVDIFE